MEQKINKKGVYARKFEMAHVFFICKNGPFDM
jgi:hypothetical protein